jgi:hypothetical protein
MSLLAPCITTNIQIQDVGGLWLGAMGVFCNDLMMMNTDTPLFFYSLL